MEEWKKYKLGEIAVIKGGKRLPKGIELISIPNSHPYIRIRDMYVNKIMELNGDFEYVDDVTQKSIQRYIVKQNDIILAIVGNTLGLVSIVGKSLDGANLTENCVKIVSDNLVTQNYIYYYLNSDFGQNEIKKGIVGAAQPKLPIKNIMDISIALPPLKYQKDVIDILSSIDDKIELNRRINDNLEQQAQAIFKSWFVDFEPFKNGKFVDSELGMIPEGWRVGTIGDYCKVRSGFAFKSSWWTNNGCKVIKIKNITNDYRLDMTDCSYVNSIYTSKADDFKAKIGDILIAMTGATIGKFCIISSSDDNTYINQRVGKFFIGDKPLLTLPFIYSCLRQDNIINEIIGKGQGSAQPNISSFDIESIKITFPNADIINHFNDISRPYFMNIIKNTAENEALRQTRDAILPQLMSGELKINDLNC